MQAGEIEALSKALEVLNNKVKEQSEVNKRALLIQDAKVPLGAETLSFLQGASVKAHTQLRGGALRTDNALGLEAKKNAALALLRTESRRIGSVTIAALAARVSADPFKKVKGLIQRLIERLLEESKAEATKKGFCDTAVGKAEHERDFRFSEALDLNREIAGLSAKEDELSTEIDMLTKDIASEEEDLKKTSEDREKEKNDNIDAIKVAKDGLAGVTEALLILKSFYNQAAKAAFLQASPVDEDTSGPGFSGNYKGKQGQSNAVFALLEVLQSDFERTIRKTEKSENDSHRDYVEFSQTSKANIAGKTTKKELDEQDLQSTKTSLHKKMDDLQTTTDLMDEALQELEALKPQCIDTGMSYKERVAKREEEIKALEKALEILAP